MEPLQHPVIILHNTNVEDVKAVVSFIYKGQCLVSKEQLPGVISIAKLLKIQGLCDMKMPCKKNTATENPVTSNKSERRLLEDNGTLKTTSDCNLSTEHAQFDPHLQLTTPTAENNKAATASAATCSDVSPRPYEPIRLDYDPTILEKLPHTKKTQKDSSETCKCFLCGKYLSNQYNLRVHMETHEEAYHACQSCPHVSRSRDALRKHISYRHPEEYHTRKKKKVEDSQLQ